MSRLSELRHNNDLGYIEASELEPNPLIQCQKWIDEAIAAGFYQANAMALSTVDSSGQPSSRIVLLKDLDQDGFYFYSNYASRKGQEISNNSKVSLLFYWDKSERQIRIEGLASKTSAEISDRYFSQRPRDSQIGAWASPQSQEIESYQILKNNESRYQQTFKNQEVSRPEHWGGFIVRAHRIELWQGRPNRLHDRLCYIKENNNWVIKRLAP